MCCDQEMYVLKEVSERRLFERRLTLLVCVPIPVLSRLRSLRPHLLDELAHRCNMPRGPPPSRFHTVAPPSPSVPGTARLRTVPEMPARQLLRPARLRKTRRWSQKKVLREADRSPATHRLVPNSSEPSSPICPLGSGRGDAHGSSKFSTM